MEQNAIVKTYRWVVFALAAFFCAYTIVVSNWAAPGGSFRYLTVWALFMSTFVAVRMLMVSYEMSDRRFDGFVSATAVINAMVVFLFWRLYFEDASSVTKDGTLEAWWREFYMHGLGAVLMWLDALFLNRVFRRIGLGLVWLLGTIVVYLTWSEQFIGRFNDVPVGTVTSGLPYPFLNDLEFPQRMEFYVTNVIVALVVFTIFCAFAFVLRRMGIRRD
ncbi:MAG: hypothetical protein AAF386_05010 [Pseudomonadota bacterium]